MSFIDSSDAKITLNPEREEFWTTIEDHWAGKREDRWKKLAVLHLYVHCGWTTDRIGYAFGHDRGHISRIIARVKEELGDRFTYPGDIGLAPVDFDVQLADSIDASYLPTERLTDEQWEVVRHIAIEIPKLKSYGEVNLRDVFDALSYALVNNSCSARGLEEVHRRFDWSPCPSVLKLYLYAWHKKMVFLNSRRALEQARLQSLVKE